MKHTLIPSLCYDILRAVHESRAKRTDHDAHVPFLSNAEIFALMPDHERIDWSRDAQPAITATTLTRMANTVEWSEESR